MGVFSTRKTVPRLPCSSGVQLRARLSKRFHARLIARAEEATAPESAEDRTARMKEQFKNPLSMEPIEAAAAGLSSPVLAAVSAAGVGLAAFVGYQAASRAPLTGVAATVVQAGTAVAGGAAVATGASKVMKKRGGAAGVELWNALSAADDPSHLDPQVGASIREKYGGSPEALEGIKKAYFAYLEALIPPGSVSLAGDEHIRAREFLNAVGLADEEAAPVHIDVGRGYFRTRLEGSDRAEQADGVRAFQKLVYVSNQLFGEMRSGFLTPWVSRFDVTPEQVLVAKRSSSRAIMHARILADLEGSIPVNPDSLQMLRKLQLNVGLTDDACADLVAELLAKDVAAQMEAILEGVKVRGGSGAEEEAAVSSVDALLERSRSLASLAAMDEAATEEPRLVPGICALSVAGTRFEREASNDLVDVFRRYMLNRMAAADGELDSELDSRLGELEALLMLPAAKVEHTRATLINEAYSHQLREAVGSGRLDAAESPASVLNELITRVSMPGEQALALHESMYKQKLRECLSDSKIDDADAKALERTARLLCLNDDTVSDIDEQEKGDILKRRVLEVIELGVDKFSAEEVEDCATLQAALRMSGEQGMALLKKVGRSTLTGMLNRARNKSDKLENAKELKKVVYFSNIVLAPLVTAFQGSAGPKKDAAMKEIAEILAEAKKAEAEKEAANAQEPASVTVEAEKDEKESTTEEAAATAAAQTTTDEKEESTTEEAATEAVAPASLEKAETAKKAVEEGDESVKGEESAQPGQKEITVAEDFERAERVDIYRTYLMYCMTGDVIRTPLGGTIVVERDQQEFARLSQLGDILGLQQMDIYEVHSAMAEESFKAQAEAAAPGGNLSAEGLKGLKEMAEKLGIQEEKSQQIIRRVTNKKVIGNLQSMKAQGELTLSKVLELKEQDVDIDSVVGENTRMQLYEQHVASVLSSGEGNVDAEHLLSTLPTELSIDVSKAAGKAAHLAKGKGRSILVQSLVHYRSKDHAAAVNSLNNLMACSRLAGGLGEDCAWGSQSELLDVFGVYCAASKEDDARAEMGTILGLSADERETVSQAVDSGKLMGSAAASQATAADTASIF